MRFREVCMVLGLDPNTISVAASRGYFNWLPATQQGSPRVLDQHHQVGMAAFARLRHVGMPIDLAASYAGEAEYASRHGQEKALIGINAGGITLGGSGDVTIVFDIARLKKTIANA